jgi:polyhydroxyalkanoate synthesis repressor PhaR
MGPYDMAETNKPDIQAEPTQPRLLQISKYPNRRFYDKTRSKHLTLEDIHALIREGYEIQVTDSKTGEDITAKVLAHMILELDPPKLQVFPAALLHRLIRANEQLVIDFTRKYFSQAFIAFMDSQKKAERYMRQAMGLESGTPSMADWAKLMWGSFGPSGREKSILESPSERPSTSKDTSDQIHDLLHRISQLQQELVQLQKKHEKRSRPKSRTASKSQKSPK